MVMSCFLVVVVVVVFFFHGDQKVSLEEKRRPEMRLLFIGYQKVKCDLQSRELIYSRF